jgi:hypothetical protein
MIILLVTRRVLAEFVSGCRNIAPARRQFRPEFVADLSDIWPPPRDRRRIKPTAIAIRNGHADAPLFARHNRAAPRNIGREAPRNIGREDVRC